jgi:hypothetical protein
MPKLVMDNSAGGGNTLLQKEMSKSRQSFRESINEQITVDEADNIPDEVAEEIRFYKKSVGGVIVAVLIMLIIGASTDAYGDFFVVPKCEGGCPKPVSKDWDKSFSCPDPVAQPTQLCLSNSSLCPLALSCPIGQEICLDGTCATIGSCTAMDDDNACGDVCGYPCMAVDMTDKEFKAATKDIPSSYFTECTENTDFVFTNDGHYVFFITWFSVLPALCLIWFNLNQRVLSNSPEYAPVMIMSANSNSENLQQTGFSNNIIGTILYFLVLASVVFIHFCLVILTVSYYNNDNDCGGWTLETDYQQALLAFEIVWGVGAVWMLFIKWPTNLRAHFYRRSPLASADYVRVWSPVSSQLLAADESIRKMDSFTGGVLNGLNSFFNAVYAERTLPTAEGKWEVCKVRVSPIGERFIMFRLRQMIYTESAKAFVAVKVDLKLGVDDLLTMIDKEGGITDEEARSRRARVGPNLIQVPKHSALYVIIAEFSKGFYTYQCFMAWTWFNFSYWHMGLVNTLVYSLGGLSIAHVTYTNMVMLGKLVEANTLVNVRVIRNHHVKVIPAALLVPGDLFIVDEGPCVVDAVILRGQAIVDESSLTGESMPVHKVAIDKTSSASGSVFSAGSKEAAKADEYNASRHKKHTLWAGTSIMQGGGEFGEAIGLVLKTGGDTDKGKQVGEILFQDPPRFKFDVQVKVVVLILFCFAIFSFFITLYFLGDYPVYGKSFPSYLLFHTYFLTLHFFNNLLLT